MMFTTRLMHRLGRIRKWAPGMISRPHRVRVRVRRVDLHLHRRRRRSLRTSAPQKVIKIRHRFMDHLIGRSTAKLYARRMSVLVRNHRRRHIGHGQIGPVGG